MTRFTLQISDQLNQWLTEQAALNHRSKNKQIEHFLDGIRLTTVNRYPLKEEKWITLRQSPSTSSGHGSGEPPPTKRNSYG